MISHTRKLLALTGMAAASLIGGTSHAASTTVVLSQVYGGGGNAGSTWKNDFIELHNISNSAISVTGWSVQYASATGTSWQVTNLAGSIPGGGYYLVQEAAGAGGTTPLPTPDATGSINMSATAGKVSLVSGTTALSGTFSNGSGAGIIDFVGFGTTANGFEGTGPTSPPGNTTSAQRLNSGSTDTDSNAADFSVGTAAPRSSATAPFIPTSTATQVSVETAPDGSGAVVPAQTLGSGGVITAYSVSRDAANRFVANVSSTWSLNAVTGGVVNGDLVAAADNKSAVFTGHSAGSAVIQDASVGLVTGTSGTITVSTAPTNPTASASADAASVAVGQAVLLTVTVTPGTNPSSTGISVTGDLSPIGGSATQTFVAASGSSFTFSAPVPSYLAGGAYTINFSAQDAQSRSAAASLILNVRGNLTIFHNNDTHARVTPDQWIIPQHSSNPQTQFETSGGAAFMAGELLQLTAGQPDALVLDGGDISEGNPLGDWNGPGNPVGTFGNGTAVAMYQLIDTKLRAVAGRGGRGLDAMVVGNHDIRDISYINNMKNQTSFPVISINICQKGTHTPYFLPYVILNVNGNKVGVVGYTTETSSSSESAVNSLIDVVKCDWSSTDTTKIHFADYVNQLRNAMGCNIVILLTHDGHSDLCTSSGGSTPILADTNAAKLPEITVSGHWHTYADSVWQPTSLNYKTIFTEDGSFMHYVGELRVNGLGKYLSNANYPLRDAAIAPDPDVANFIQTRKAQYAATNPTYGLDQVIGYTADDLLLDNKFKWWSSDEYPWSGNNTAGNWICDGLLWKAVQTFGQCDLSLESGGGVRSDIPAGPVSYTQIYETYPWADDTLYMVKMTGQQIWNYFEGHNCDVALSRGWFVTAYDGIPTSITVNGQPIDLNHTYNVAISNYMYANDSVPFTDPSPQTTTILNRDALVQFTAQYPQSNPYQAGLSRYSLNTEFSGGYRAVVLMMNDADSSTTFDDGFIRLLSATPETVGHLGTPQVPTSLVNPDGSIVATNRLSEIEAYRSYLGFRTGVLHPGDIIETWGKGSFFGGDPEFVDQEGITADGIEFKIVGHDASLAKPTFMPSIAAFFNSTLKNHYVKFLAKKTAANTVSDQTGQTMTVMDVTAFSSMVLPGNVGDLLVLTGIPTSESNALRFRCDSAALASSIGVSSFPPASTVSSHVSPLSATTTSSSIALTAAAQVNSNNTWSLSPIADASVSSLNPTSNTGTSNNLFIESSTGGFGNERAWLKFDLSTLPTGAIITGASLQLFCWSATGTSMPAEVDAASADTWTETGITWNNQPAPGTTIATQTLASGATNVTYSWDVTSFVQGEFAGDKVASMVAKPVTESSAAAQSYGFDSKEFGSTGPVLQVTTQASSSPVTVAQVQYFYRYSADNATWSAWTASSSATIAPYAANFAFSQGFGFYEFYSLASDSLGAVEPAPAAAEAAVHYSASPPYSTDAVIILSWLSQAYDGAPEPVTVTTVPAGLSVSVVYSGSPTVPMNVGAYPVTVTVTQAGFNGSITGTLQIAQGAQSIAFAPISPTNVGAPPFTANAVASSGLTVAFASDNPAVATVSGNTITIVGAGTANITASQAGNANYLPAPPVVQPVTAAPQGSGAPAGGDSDVPAMPAWTLAALAAILVATALPFLRKGRRA